HLVRGAALAAVLRVPPRQTTPDRRLKGRIVASGQRSPSRREATSRAELSGGRIRPRCGSRRWAAAAIGCAAAGIRVLLSWLVLLGDNESPFLQIRGECVNVTVSLRARFSYNSPTCSCSVSLTWQSRFELAIPGPMERA